MADMLKQGSKGDAVVELQNKLVKLGYQIKADGAFGPNTKAAVEELQTAFGYDIDGVVGKGTIALVDAQVGHGWRVDQPGAIKRALVAQGKQTEKGSLAGVDLKRTLKKGTEGADVSYLQRRLAELGYAVKASGNFDDATEATVKQLQQDFGYTVDGMVGPGTHKLINAQIGHDFKAGGAKAAPSKQAPTKQAPTKGA